MVTEQAGGGGGGLVFLPNIIVNDSYIIRVGNGGEGREDAGENGYNSSIEKQDGQGINGIANFLALGGGGGGDGRTTSQYSGPGNVGGSGGEEVVTQHRQVENHTKYI